MNLRVTDQFVLRCDQPNIEAWPIFFQAGVQAVMCFRKDDESGYSLQEETDAVLASGIKEFVSIPVGGMPYDAPTEPQMEQAIVLLRDGRKWLIHCRRGCDRTGVFAGRYRIATGWTVADAIVEAKQCGMSRFQFRMHEFLEHSKT